MSSLPDIVDDVNPEEKTAVSVTALMKPFESEYSNKSAFNQHMEFRYRQQLDIVGGLLKGSTQIVVDVLQGSEVHVEKIEISRFPNSELRKHIRLIVCKMEECKNGVEPEEKGKTILNMLPKYLWGDKAVATLAAFAVVFRNFCVVANSSKLLKQKLIIHQLKEIIEIILQVIEKNDQCRSAKLPEPLWMGEISNPIITTVVACAIVVSNLTNDKESDKLQNLSSYLKQIQEVFNTIEERQIIWTKEQDEFKAKKELLESRTEFVKILKTKLSHKDVELVLYHFMESREMVTINGPRGKNVFLFISTLDNVSKNEILLLKAVYEETKKDNNHTIVWIPIEEDWTDELFNKLDAILSFSNEMFWCVFPSFSVFMNGIQFFKASCKPALLRCSNPIVYTNPKFTCISGMERIYFSPPRLSSRSGASRGMGVGKKRFVFYCEGKDEWIKQFREKVTAVDNHTFLKKKYIEIKVTNKDPDKPAIARSIKKLIKKLINKLRFDENRNQWATLYKDSRVVISGDGSKFLTVLDQFDLWKEDLNEKDFDLAFQGHFETLRSP